MAIDVLLRHPVDWVELQIDNKNYIRLRNWNFPIHGDNFALIIYIVIFILFTVGGGEIFAGLVEQDPGNGYYSNCC